MFYPLKFEPVYKDYIWGGRNLEKFGKKLPEGIVAESWEVSCHNDGMSIITNGEAKGLRLADYIKANGTNITGTALPEEYAANFPLLVKLIDANDKLSVQVHPDDSYAFANENGENGKNEMWYIISAEKGSRLIYDVMPGTGKAEFLDALQNEKLDSCLKQVEVQPGDIINIPAGLIHAIGKGIVLAEVQQNSNATYRVYDYNRVDKNGNKRPLHIEKAIDVIDFNSEGRKEKYRGLPVDNGKGLTKLFLAATKFYGAEHYSLNGQASESTEDKRFEILTFLKGEGSIAYGNNSLKVSMGESVLIPAALGKYIIEGSLEAIRSYIPDVLNDFVSPLMKAGYSTDEITENVGGINIKKA